MAMACPHFRNVHFLFQELCSLAVYVEESVLGIFVSFILQLISCGSFTTDKFL
jgi:hypothetical protein